MGQNNKRKRKKKKKSRATKLSLGDPTPQVTWPFDQVVIWQIYIYFPALPQHLGCQTYQDGKLVWGDSINKATWPVDHVVMLEMKEFISVLP